MVLRDSVSVKLGESYTQVESIEVRRQNLILQRREPDDLRTTLRQEVDRVMVIEAERTILGDPDPCTSRQLVHQVRSAMRRKRSGGVGDAPDRCQVEALRHQIGKTFECCPRHATFAARDQSKVSLRALEEWVSGKAVQDRQTRRRDNRVGRRAKMALAADL